MPLLFSSATTPAGREYRRVVARGAVTEDDARALNKDIATGGPFARHPILGLVEPGAEFSAEARQALVNGTKDENDKNQTAIVVNSAPLRVMLTFVVRISGGADNTKFFSTEGPALAWLDESTAAAKRTA